MASLTYAIDFQTSGAVSSLASLEKQISGLGTSAINAGKVIAGALIFKGIINTTRELEELRGAFTTVTGSVAKSVQEFDRIRDLSMALGTSQKALSETYVKLANAGIKPTNALLTTLVDVSKNSTDQFGALTAATDLFSRTVSGGLGLEDLNRLQDRGIPVFKILQEQLGLSRLEIAKFGQTAAGAEKIRQALYKGFQEQFGGTSLRELNSINSQLMVFETLSNAAQESFGQGLVDAISKSVGTVGELGGGIQAVAKLLGEALGGAIVFVINNLNILIPLVSGLAAAWAAVKLFELAQGIIAMASAFKALTMAMMRNPITIIAVAVAALIAGFVALVAETGSVGNAFKTLGNVGINVVNTLINAYNGFGQFIANLMTGVGRAILAGLNPFSDKSAVGELQNGFQKGMMAFKQQVASDGPIKFKFKLDPVISKTKPDLDLGAGGYDSGIDQQALENAAAIKKAMGEQATAARETTKQLENQLKSSNAMRQLQISLIGGESNYSKLVQDNATARADTAKEIADLQGKINVENAKGVETNKSVVAELRKQQELRKSNLENTLSLNQAEYNRQVILKDLTSDLESQAAFTMLINESMINDQQVSLIGKFGDELQRSQGYLGALASLMNNVQSITSRTFNQLAPQMPTEGLDEFTKKFTHFSIVVRDFYKTWSDGTEMTMEDLERLGDARTELSKTLTDGQKVEIANMERIIQNEASRYKMGKDYVDKVLVKQNELQQKYTEGAQAQMDQLAKQFTPYQMAQDAISIGWRNISDALDRFIETGKFSFKDFARSILADLSKMVARALVFKYIFEPLMGSLGLSTAKPLSIPGLATGGPASAGQPYMVGEKGPELFVPKNSGDIVSNNKLGRAGQATGMISAPVTNNYITNNINALDSRSVAQLFVENRKTLLGTVQMAQKEMPYRTI